MDSVTHILSAALVTEPLEPPENSGPRYARWREPLAILLAALAPDGTNRLRFLFAEHFNREQLIEFEQLENMLDFFIANDHLNLPALALHDFIKSDDYINAHRGNHRHR